MSEVCEPDLGKEKDYLFSDVQKMNRWTGGQTDHYRVQ